MVSNDVDKVKKLLNLNIGYKRVTLLIYKVHITICESFSLVFKPNLLPLFLYKNTCFHLHHELNRFILEAIKIEI